MKRLAHSAPAERLSRTTLARRIASRLVTAQRTPSDPAAPYAEWAELERRVASVRAAPQGRAFVPDVTDRPAKQGVRVLERLGFEVERVVRRVPPEEGNEGEVASTSPGRGRLVARGATVTMVVTTQR